jgi:hypothetical protein
MRTPLGRKGRGFTAEPLDCPDRCPCHRRDTSPRPPSPMGSGVAGRRDYVTSVGFDHLLVVWAHVRDIHLVVAGCGRMPASGPHAPRPSARLRRSRRWIRGSRVVTLARSVVVREALGRARRAARHWPRDDVHARRPHLGTGPRDLVASLGGFAPRPLLEQRHHVRVVLNTDEPVGDLAGDPERLRPKRRHIDGRGLDGRV